MKDGRHAQLVEIPRFKKRELNLGLVRGSGPWRVAWCTVWVIWLLNGLFALVSRQCHPVYLVLM